MDQGSFNSKDIVDGRIKPSEIKLKYIIIYDTGKLNNLGRAINIMANAGWIVKAGGGVSNGGFFLLEKV